MRSSLSFSHLLCCLVVSAAFMGCASPNPSSSSDGRGNSATAFGSEPEGVWEKSKASGASYAADAFTFRKQQPIGSKNNFEFYYKHCEDKGRSFYSKTDFECTGP